MKKLELKNALFSRLIPMLDPFKFFLVRRMDWFVRKGDSQLIYRLDFYDGQSKDTNYSVSPSLAVRIERVEQVFHKVSGFEPKYRKDSPTIWVSLNDLKKDQDEYEYVLDSFENLDALVRTLFILFKDVALPFLEENSSVQAINNLLNSEPEADNNIYCIPEKRLFRGVIIAKLAKDVRYGEIAMIYREKVERYLPYRLADFDKLLNILEEL
jgi:hypothetical protein